MRTALLVFVGLFVAGSFPCQAQEEPSRDILLREVLAMNEKINALTHRVAELEGQLKAVRELAEMPEFEKHRLHMERQRPGRQAPLGQGADHEALAGITLPENANRGQVALYIRQILDTSANQTIKASDDPQPQMLVKLGPENLGPMLDAWKPANASRGMGQQYLTEAIGLLMDNNTHKQLLLDRLVMRPELITFVLKHGWLEDARPIMIAAVKDGNAALTLQWMNHLVGFKDPRTYDALAETMATSPMPAHYYAMIKDLPGIELDDAVHRTWKRLRAEQHFGHFGGQFAPIAIEHGNADALGWLVDLLHQRDFDQQVAGFGRLENKSVRDTILRYIDFEGSDDEIKTWYYKNKDRLEFDKKRKVFKTKPGPVFPPPF